MEDIQNLTDVGEDPTTPEDVMVTNKSNWN
jgi:hypothetical protein